MHGHRAIITGHTVPPGPGVTPGVPSPGLILPDGGPGIPAGAGDTPATIPVTGPDIIRVIIPDGLTGPVTITTGTILITITLITTAPVPGVR